MTSSRTLSSFVRFLLILTLLGLASTRVSRAEAGEGEVAEVAETAEAPAEPQAEDQSAEEGEVAEAAETAEAPTEPQAEDPPVEEETEPAAEELLELDGERLEWATAAFEAKCALCHEKDGSSDDPRMNLVDLVWEHGETLADIERTIREGVPGTLMKPHNEKLTPEEIRELAIYVKLLSVEGHGKSEEGDREAATELTDMVAQQLPASPPVEVKDRENYIDEHIFGKMKADGVPHAGLCSDQEFLRRIYLDLWGRLPDTAKVRQFIADTDPEKRNKLIDNLLCLDFMNKPGNDDYKGPWLAEKPFIEKWTYFFSDLFRNGPQGNPEPFHDYIYQFVRYNIPYNYIVEDMLTASTFHNSVNGAAGFMIRHQIDGLRCADVMHEDTCDEIAVYTTKLFLGVNLECVSCHDGAGHLDQINLWLSKRKRVEFWRQAAFFGDVRIIRPGLTGQEFTLLDGAPLRPERIWNGGIDKFEFTSAPTATGGMGYRMEAPSVLRVARDTTADVYPEFVLTKERPAEGHRLRREYARMVTTSPQFAKAAANLIWSRLMTVGIVDPPFDWDLARQDPKNPPPAPWTIQPSHPELLDALAEDFIESNYDLRLLMRRICRSKAYQLSSRFDGEYKPEWDRYYARRLVRRLSAEEVYDAIAKATNVFGHGMEYSLAQVGPAGDAELSRFLSFFGQGNRQTKQPDTKGSIIQASLMLNSSLIKEKVLAATEGSRVKTLLNRAPALSNLELVEELFLTTLSRYPTPEEMVKAVKHVEDYRNKGVEDLQWALLNKMEFIVNY